MNHHHCRSTESGADTHFVGTLLGISASRQDPAAALLDAHTLEACEESRLSRLRFTEASTVPTLVVSELLAFLGRSPDDVHAVAVISRGQFTGREATPVDHHLAHAAYGFASSPFDDAVVVCDSSTEQGWTPWRDTATGLAPLTDDLGAFPLAATSGQLTGALGFIPGQGEHIVEALARVGTAIAHPAADTITVGDDGLVVEAGALMDQSQCCPGSMWE